MVDILLAECRYEHNRHESAPLIYCNENGYKPINMHKYTKDCGINSHSYYKSKYNVKSAVHDMQVLIKCRLGYVFFSENVCGNGVPSRSHRTGSLHVSELHMI